MKNKKHVIVFTILLTAERFKEKLEETILLVGLTALEVATNHKH